ncbi:MAG: AI-2E family transporter [Candidatus Izemoplasma sp.]|nr:AI-2E family transporter [Candidatus Izemoplasma sp.]
MDKQNKFLSDQFLNKAIRVLVVILLSLAILLLASQFNALWFKFMDALRSVLVPVALAWLISLIMYPLIRLLEQRGVGSRGLSVSVVYIGSISVFLLVIYYLWPFLISQVRSFFENDWVMIQLYFENDFRNEFIFGTEIYDWIIETINNSTIIEDTISSFVDNVTASLSSTLINVFTVIIVLPILLLYYLLDYELINDSMRSLIPARFEKSTSELGSRFNHTVGAYLRGQLVLMLAIGIVATILYKLIGLQYFFIFGIIVGLTNIIPYFGAIIAMVPVVIYAVITRDTGPAPLLVVAVNIGLQMIEGNIFQPIIMGKQLEMHPIVIIVSILFFGSLFGTIGVVFASPIAASIRVLYQFYKEKQHEKSGEEVVASDA